MNPCQREIMGIKGSADAWRIVLLHHRQELPRKTYAEVVMGNICILFLSRNKCKGINTVFCNKTIITTVLSFSFNNHATRTGFLLQSKSNDCSCVLNAIDYDTNRNNNNKSTKQQLDH